MARKVQQINNIRIYRYTHPDTKYERDKYFTVDPDGFPLGDHETLADARRYARSNTDYLRGGGRL